MLYGQKTTTPTLYNNNITLGNDLKGVKVWLNLFLAMTDVKKGW